MEKKWQQWKIPTAERLTFEVDKLTRSIEHRESGRSIGTRIEPVAATGKFYASRRRGWLFDWTAERKKKDRTVYRLAIDQQPDFIQGLVSLEKRSGHVFMHLLECAPYNRGKDKIFLGVAGNLVAYACRLSFELKMEGYVAFYAKNSLLGHYEKTLGASHKGSQLMIIEPPASLHLVRHYFKKFTS